MFNYHNILPYILTTIFFILLIEGIIFFTYLVKEQELLIKKSIQQILNNKFNIAYDNDVINYIKMLIESQIALSMYKEKSFIDDEYKLGVIFFALILIGVLILLFVYIYIVYKVLHKKIDWMVVGITVFITICMILLLEYLYITYILFNKQFNSSQIALYVINSIATEM